MHDIPLRGLKALFCSNSCAAYRRTAFEKVGGFPETLPLGEDMAITARLLEAGYTTVYCADAEVRHSHNYTSWQEFKRYFDIGALMKTDPWLKANKLKSSGEGLRFVISETKYLLGKGAFFEILKVPFRTAAKNCSASSSVSDMNCYPVHGLRHSVCTAPIGSAHYDRCGDRKEQFPW